MRGKKTENEKNIK